MILPRIKSLSELDLFFIESEETSLQRMKSKSFNDCLNKLVSNNYEINKIINDDENLKDKDKYEDIPEKYGLDNSFKIIPSYYMKNGNLMHIDFYEIIIDDIRNMRKLNEYQLKYIKESCDEKQKLIIIELFNECVSALVTIL